MLTGPLRWATAVRRRDEAGAVWQGTAVWDWQGMACTVVEQGAWRLPDGTVCAGTSKWRWERGQLTVWQGWAEHAYACEISAAGGWRGDYWCGADHYTVRAAWDWAALAAAVQKNAADVCVELRFSVQGPTKNGWQVVSYGQQKGMGHDGAA